MIDYICEHFIAQYFAMESLATMLTREPMSREYQAPVLAARRPGVCRLRHSSYSAALEPLYR